MGCLQVRLWTARLSIAPEAAHIVPQIPFSPLPAAIHSHDKLLPVPAGLFSEGFLPPTMKNAYDKTSGRH